MTIIQEIYIPFTVYLFWGMFRIFQDRKVGILCTMVEANDSYDGLIRRFFKELQHFTNGYCSGPLNGKSIRTGADRRERDRF